MHRLPLHVCSVNTLQACHRGPLRTGTDIGPYRYTGSIPVYRRAALKTGGSGTWARQTGGIPVWAGRGAISPLLYPTFAYFLFKFCVSWNTTQCGHPHRQMSRGDRVRSGRSGCMPSILKYHIHTRSFHSRRPLGRPAGLSSPGVGFGASVAN